MKNSIPYFILAMLLISCNEEKRLLEYSQEKADQFLEMYSAEFLQDSELLRYNYNPRAHFTHGQNDSNIYRIIVRDNEIRLICFSDSCELTESFNDKPLKVSKGKYFLKQDSIFTEHSYDSTTIKIHDFKQNPEEYFNGLKKQLEKYGVFGYSKSTDKSFVKIYLSVQYYLINSKNVENDINEDEIIKSYENNWYFVKMKRQMDLG